MKKALLFSLTTTAQCLASNLLKNKITSKQANNLLASNTDDDYAYRSKRANSHLFEEIGGNDLQRECIDEVCNYEEFLEAWNDLHGTRDKVENLTDKIENVAFSVDNDEKNGDPVEIYRKLSSPCSFLDCHTTQTKTCENYWNYAKCECEEGYEGQLCENDINECQQNDNLCNNGVCENLIGSYECICNDGWTGSHCDQDENECLIENICGTGNCTNTEGSFTCDCVEGWRGQHCEIDVDECTDDILTHNCNENQYCHNLLGSFECKCRGGYSGEDCQDDLDECSLPGVCPPGSVCSTPEFNSFVCSCPEDGCTFD